MSFINKLCRSLGFGGEEEYETEELAADAADTDTPDAVPDEKEEDKQYSDMREEIFTQVLNVFNTALPDFIARSVDPAAQRKLLFDSLDQGLKDYVARIGADADTRCELRWSEEQSQLRTDMETLRHKSAQIEAERAELKQKQLSAERQKRALSDRLKDLEKQIDTLEAEREQFELENKSLLNKLKVMAVQSPETKEVPVEIDDSKNAEEVERLTESCHKLEAENESLRTQLQQAAERQTMADEMCADLRRRLAVSQKEVEDLQAITEQVEIVRQAIEERDKTLERQRDNIGRLKTQIETLTSSARAAADNASARERELLDRIAQLEEKKAAEELVSEETPVEKKPRKRAAAPKKPEPEPVVPKITDDDLMDVESGFADHSWFGASEPEPQAPQPVSDNDDFGYHAPEPKPRPYDDGMQMSLFDD